VDEPPGPVRPSVAERWYWLWDAYILALFVVALAVTVADTDTPAGRRLGAAGALTCIVLWYQLYGRRVIRRGDEGWPAYLFIAGVLVLLGVELLFMPKNSLVLFVLYPMFFMAVPLRVALPAVIGASAVQAGILLLDGGHGDNLIPPLVGMVISVVMGTLIDRTITETQQRGALIEQLEASRAEVARLSHEAGIAAERARLAREIHDTLAQGFTSIVALVQAVESELDGEQSKARGHLTLAARTARDNLAEARALVAALSPSALDGRPLEEAVRRQVERLGEETAITATYRTVGEPAELPTAVEVVLLRAVQEALANVRNHSRASSVIVTLRYAGSAVTLSVVDDGIGIGGPEGFGLRGMRARAEQVSGTLVVIGLPGKGTRLELEVPR
jgi:signal transduction histidine kinase